MKTTKKALKEQIVILDELIEAQEMEIKRLREQCAVHREIHKEQSGKLEESRKDNAILARQNGELALQMEKVTRR